MGLQHVEPQCVPGRGDAERGSDARGSRLARSGDSGIVPCARRNFKKQHGRQNRLKAPRVRHGVGSPEGGWVGADGRCECAVHGSELASGRRSQLVPCVARDANMGHHLAGSWQQKLMSRIGDLDHVPCSAKRSLIPAVSRSKAACCTAGSRWTRIW